MTTAADLYQDIMRVEDAANRLAAVAAQSLADARALAERVKAMPPLATDMRIALAEFLDCPVLTFISRNSRRCRRPRRLSSPFGSGQSTGHSPLQGDSNES